MLLDGVRKKREQQKQRLSSQNPELMQTKECNDLGGKKVEVRRVKSNHGRPKMSKSKDEDKGESEEAAVGNESDGRRKEIADKYRSRLKSRDLFCVLEKFCQIDGI